MEAVLILGALVGNFKDPLVLASATCVAILPRTTLTRPCLSNLLLTTASTPDQHPSRLPSNTVSYTIVCIYLQGGLSVALGSREVESGKPN